MEVSSHALTQAPRRRDPLRRGGVHQPVPRPSRLPRDDGGLFRRQGVAVHPGASRPGRGQRGRPLGPADPRPGRCPDGGVLDGRGERRRRAPPDHTSFTWRGRRVELALTGSFHVANALAAATTAAALGVPEDVIVTGLNRAAPVPGRFEVRRHAGPVHGRRRLRPHPRGAPGRARQRPCSWPAGHRVLCVFGCGGDRDHDKRPAMGAVAAADADVAVVTSDNPRNEDPDAIIDEVMAGVPAGSEVDRPAPSAPRPSSSPSTWPPRRRGGGGGQGPRARHRDRHDAPALRRPRRWRPRRWPGWRPAGRARGRHAVISLMTSGGIALWVGRAGHAAAHPVVGAPALRAADPRGRPLHASGQGRDPHHGGPGPDRGGGGGLPDGPRRHPRGLQPARHCS